MSEQARSEEEIQRQYYRDTASKYNEMHVNEKDAHFLALSFMVSALDYIEARSILDIGCGTGRAVTYLKRMRPDIRIVGLEPVDELRNIGYANGLSEADLVGGDAKNLQFADGDFDLVCEFGVLHHIKNPGVAIAEMLRVARKGIFISDCNNFGQGSLPLRTLKQALNALGLWGLFDYMKTAGKGYTLTEGDGLAYSYSVYNDYPLIKKACKEIYVMNTTHGGVNPYRSAPSIGLLGLK